VRKSADELRTRVVNPNPPGYPSFRKSADELRARVVNPNPPGYTSSVPAPIDVAEKPKV